MFHSLLGIVDHISLARPMNKPTHFDEAKKTVGEAGAGGAAALEMGLQAPDFAPD
jgi:hypothetical protein